MAGVVLTVGTTTGHQVAAPLERWIVAILCTLDAAQLARVLELAEGRGVEPFGPGHLPPQIISSS